MSFPAFYFFLLLLWIINFTSASIIKHTVYFRSSSLLGFILRCFFPKSIHEVQVNGAIHNRSKFFSFACCVSTSRNSNVCFLAVSQCCRRWFLGKTRRRAAWASLSGVVLGYREAVSSPLCLKVPERLRLLFFFFDLLSDCCLSCPVAWCLLCLWVSVQYIVAVALVSVCSASVLFDSIWLIPASSPLKVCMHARHCGIWHHSICWGNS